jgi:ubiquinone/menaquinone biosynthesis C-methylase UbiE
MYRLQNPQLALQGIYRALKPGGMFVAAFPVKGNSIMSEAIAIVDSRPQWKDFFTSPDRKAYALADKTYRQWLTDANFMVIKSRTKWEDETFKSREKFRDLLRATFSQEFQFQRRH